MVKRLAVLFLLLGLVQPALVVAKTRSAAYALDRDTLALGEPLQLRITRAVSGGGPALETLDVGALQRDFEILERTLGRDSAQETLTLTLYARRSGRFELPALGQAGRPLRVTVTEGSDRLPRVQWKLSLDPSEPLLRQPVTFTLEACDDGTLLWKRPQLPSTEGLLLRPLNETEIITTRDGQRCTAHRWHWALLPTASGALTLSLPVAEASKFGTRLRYTPPPLELRTSPLPAWLPSEAAVGAPEFVAEPLPAQAVLEQPLAWRLRVSGAYSAQALQQQLALQLRETDARLGLDTYTPQVEPQASLALLPQQRVTLFLVPRERGVFELPALQLPWYDPATGLLQQTRLGAVRIEVLDPLRLRWLWAAGGLGGLVLLAVLGNVLRHLLGWRVQRWRVRRRLMQAATPAMLRRELKGYSLRRAEAAAPTLRSWQARMEAQSDSRGLAQLVDGLESAQFAGADESLPLTLLQPGLGTADEFALLRQLAVTWIGTVRPHPHSRKKV